MCPVDGYYLNHCNILVVMDDLFRNIALFIFVYGINYLMDAEQQWINIKIYFLMFLLVICSFITVINVWFYQKHRYPFRKFKFLKWDCKYMIITLIFIEQFIMTILFPSITFDYVLNRTIFDGRYWGRRGLYDRSMKEFFK